MIPCRWEKKHIGAYTYVCINTAKVMTGHKPNW